jgi:hypothetical protein
MANVSSDAGKAGHPVRGHRHQKNNSNIRPRAPRAKLARTSTDLELVSRIGIDEKGRKHHRHVTVPRQNRSWQLNVVL